MITNYQHFRIDEGLKDRVTIWIDAQGRSVNALSEPVFDELLQIVESERRRARQLPLVFRSAKRESFIVGADLRRIASITTDVEIQAFLLHGQTVLESLERLPGVTIAIIHGPCLGGGLEFALACKIRIAVNSTKTQLGMPESKLGLMPGWGGTQRLPRTVGVSEALNMLLTGQSITAQRALELQLVDAVAEESMLEEGVTAFLRRLADLPTIEDRHSKGRKLDRDLFVTALGQFDLTQYGSLSAAQNAIYHAVSIGLNQTFDLGAKAERELFYSLLTSAEVRENLQRFVNRPKPSS